MVNTQLKILRVFGPTGAEVSSVLRGIRDDGCPGLRLLERDGEFAICVQVSAPNRAMAEQYCDKWAARLRAKFGDDVFAEGETSLAQATLDALLEKRKLLVAVDEPTGRLLGSLLQPLPHSEAVFDFGTESYADPQKSRRITVPEQLLRRFPGDIVQAGVIISNSEVGLGSVSIQPLIYRLVCSNGMVVNEAAARRNHVGRVTDSEENFSVYSQATLDAEDKAFVMKIQDTVRAAVEEARFSQIVGKMQEAKAAQMDTHDVPAVVKLASKEFHITDSESTGVLQRLIESNDLTLYGLSNAVTRHSQDMESYDRASELESIGYSILTMPAQQWSRINRAAT